MLYLVAFADYLVVVVACNRENVLISITFLLA
jgi:hypothetical protein